MFGVDVQVDCALASRDEPVVDMAQVPSDQGK